MGEKCTPSSSTWSCAHKSRTFVWCEVISRIMSLSESYLVGELWKCGTYVFVCECARAKTLSLHHFLASFAGSVWGERYYYYSYALSFGVYVKCVRLCDLHEYKWTNFGAKNVVASAVAASVDAEVPVCWFVCTTCLDYYFRINYTYFRRVLKVNLNTSQLTSGWLDGILVISWEVRGDVRARGRAPTSFWH